MTSSISSWVSAPTRTDIIEGLVSGVGAILLLHFLLFTYNSLLDRYNPSNVSILEDYLYHQIRSQEYDCLANLAILKLFIRISFETFIFLTSFVVTSSIPISTTPMLLSTYS